MTPQDGVPNGVPVFARYYGGDAQQTILKLYGEGSIDTYSTEGHRISHSTPDGTAVFRRDGTPIFTVYANGAIRYVGRDGVTELDFYGYVTD